jgi:hypothetical protein
MRTVLEKDSAVLTAQVAAMNADQRWVRLVEIADSGDKSDESALEFVKLFFGPDATLSTAQ